MPTTNDTAARRRWRGLTLRLAGATAGATLLPAALVLAKGPPSDALGLALVVAMGGMLGWALGSDAAGVYARR